MADSLNFSSINFSSETNIHAPCEPCDKDGIQKVAAGYCPICVEFYCVDCLRAHRRSSITESHKIETGDKMPKSIADKPMKYQICDKHYSAHKDKYCFEHTSVICPVCSLRDHGQCIVKPVSEAYKSFNVIAEEQTFSGHLQQFLEYAKSVKTSVEVNESKLEAQIEDILNEAKAQRDKVIKQVKQSFKEFSTEVKNIVKEQKAVMNNKHSAIDRLVVELSPILHSLQQSAARKQNDQKRFIDLYKHAQNVRLCETEFQCLELKFVDIKCNFNGSIQPLMVSNNRLGDVSLHNSTVEFEMSCPDIIYPYRYYPQGTDQSARAPEVSQCRPLSVNPTSLEKINVNLNDDTNDCLINGLDPTTDGNILLVDSNNSKVKLFAPDGLLLCSLKLPGKPLDITTVNKSEAAVSMWPKKIGIIGIDGGLLLKRTITTRYYVNSIVACENNLIITSDDFYWKIGSVQMISMTGEVKWTVKEDTQSNKLFDCARFLTIRYGDNGDTVIITDSSKHTITVLDVKTGKANKIIDTKEKVPRGITVDDNGKVYVCYQSGEVSVFLGHTEEEYCLVSGRERLEFEPGAMIYDHRRSQILIACNALETKCSNFIYMYKFQTVLAKSHPS